MITFSLRVGRALVHTFESASIVGLLRCGRRAHQYFRTEDFCFQWERRVLFARDVGVAIEMRVRCPTRGGNSAGWKNIQVS